MSRFEVVESMIAFWIQEVRGINVQRDEAIDKPANQVGAVTPS